MFEEMVGWAVEEGADLIIGETFYYAGEALVFAALEVAKSTGLPVVLTIAPMAMEEMADGVGSSQPSSSSSRQVPTWSG